MFSLSAILAGGFLILLALVLLLNLISLPANWIIIGLIGLWKLCLPAMGDLNLLFWIIVICLAIAGEVLETVLSMIQAKRHGSSSSGTFMGVIGAIVGAIIMAPLFLGLGAMIGAFIGAWCGCFLMELLKGRPHEEALQAALGALLGRFMGTICKIGIGAVIIAVTAHYIWPEGSADSRLEQSQSAYVEVV